MMGARLLHAKHKRASHYNRKHLLEHRLERKRKEEALRFNAWFEQFDQDKSRTLDKSELAVLMLSIQPDSPPDDVRLLLC